MNTLSTKCFADKKSPKWTQWLTERCVCRHTVRTHLSKSSFSLGDVVVDVVVVWIRHSTNEQIQHTIVRHRRWQAKTLRTSITWIVWTETCQIFSFFTIFTFLSADRIRCWAIRFCASCWTWTCSREREKKQNVASKKNNKNKLENWSKTDKLIGFTFVLFFVKWSSSSLDCRQ